MTARAEGTGSNQNQETAACFVLMARCRVPQFNKIILAVREGGLSWQICLSIQTASAMSAGTAVWTGRALQVGKTSDRE